MEAFLIEDALKPDAPCVNHGLYECKIHICMLTEKKQNNIISNYKTEIEIP